MERQEEICPTSFARLFKFEVVTAFGIEARYTDTRYYKIRVKSPELSNIRKELTGLSTGQFVILVGIRNPWKEVMDEMMKRMKLLSN